MPLTQTRTRTRTHTHAHIHIHLQIPGECLAVLNEIFYSSNLLQGHLRTVIQPVLILCRNLFFWCLFDSITMSTSAAKDLPYNRIFQIGNSFLDWAYCSYCKVLRAALVHILFLMSRIDLEEAATCDILKFADT